MAALWATIVRLGLVGKHTKTDKPNDYWAIIVGEEGWYEV